MSEVMMQLQQAAAWMEGARLVGDPARPIARVHTDSRSLQAGDLFVALKGERFDANEFLAQAQAAGASAALCHAPFADQLAALGLPGIVVDDSKRALGQLAGGWRAQFKLPLIAITGSNGKTTVTQMVAAILRAFKPDTLATQGNLNNDIGVPMTLLRLRAQHQLAVVELGMNHPGEIAGLAAMARPTVALVNNAQREHLEFMATVEAVARENGCVLQALAGNGTAVFPSDDAYSGLWHELAGARATLTFALDNHDGHTDVYCTRPAQWIDGGWAVQASTPAGPLSFRLRVAGAHNVKNALAATACALAAGVPLAAVAQGLEQFEPVKGRSRALALSVAGMACTLVDDSYNANPDSVRAAVEVLAALPGPRLLVLGDMGEVGQQGPQFHAEIGALARERGIEQVLTLGELTQATTDAYGGGRHFGQIEDINRAALAELPRMRSVLVKGSRFMQMERVVQALSAHAQATNSEEPHAA